MHEIAFETNQPANDSRESWERLATVAELGAEVPEALTHTEIKQVCFVLAVLLSEKAPQRS